jgi:membrane-associated PAP2 superfamily phosphatase
MYRYNKSHLMDIYLTSIVLIGLMFLFHQTFLDEWVASHFFLAPQQWIYRDNFFLEKILHKGGVILTIVLLVLFVGRWLILFKKPDQKLQRDYVGFIVIASLLTILSIFFLKQISTLPCPWNSLAFGGGANPPTLWKMFSSDLPSSHCFPGGHSSGGYAFLSIYFGFTFIYGKRMFITCLPGVLIGLTFGITQQLRGAHFLSHDVATILISILCSWLTSLIFTYRLKKQLIS